MAATMQEIYAFVNKFVQISTSGLETSLSFTSDGINVTTSLNAQFGKLVHPPQPKPQQHNAPQPFHHHSKPSRIRLRKRRQDLRNQPAGHHVNDSNSNATDTINSNGHTSDEPE